MIVPIVCVVNSSLFRSLSSHPGSYGVFPYVHMVYFRMFIYYTCMSNRKYVLMSPHLGGCCCVVVWIQLENTPSVSRLYNTHGKVMRCPYLPGIHDP